MGLKHIYEDGHLYYVTTVTQNCLPIFTSASFVIPLFDSLNFYQYQLAIWIVGYVVMPDHIHLLLWPQGEHTVSDFMRDFKGFTAKRIARQARAEERDEWVKVFEKSAENTPNSIKVWQDDFWDKAIFRVRFLREKLNYMHRNPLRAGLVDSPEEYPYSSYRNYTQDDQSLIKLKQDWLL